MKSVITIFILAAFLFGIGMSQEKSTKRRFVPVTYKTDQAPLFGLRVEEWTAFAFDRQTQTWRTIPFQFDQLNDKGLFDSKADGLADATDEIVFLPGDAGDRAEPSQWIADESSRNYARIELEFSDPLNPDEKAWVYLYHHAAAAPDISGYLNYIPGPADSPAADSLRTATFLLGHDPNGWIDYLKFSNLQEDLIDRFKLRLAGDMLIGPAYEINEDFIESGSGDDLVVYRPGPVRAFHSIKAAILLEKLNLPLLPSTASFKFEYVYTPYSFEITAETDIDASMLTLFGVRTIRQSLDFSSGALGMKMFTPTNPDGVLIDGVPDSFSDTIDENSSRNWVMASGPQGTIILIIDISLMKNSQRRLYYYDDVNSTAPPDGTIDTGDGRSYGDMGILVRATGDALIANQLVVNFKSYFIDQPNESLAFGEQVMAWENNPMLLQAQEQNYVPPAAIVSEADQVPARFVLGQAYPNPFSSSRGSQVRFNILAHPSQQVRLIVYDLLGRQVATFEDVETNSEGRAMLSWDGYLQNGGMIPPGIYFYRISNGIHTTTSKLVITR